VESISLPKRWKHVSFLKQLKIKKEWVEMKSRNLANVSQIWALLSPPNVKAVNKVGFAA